MQRPKISESKQRRKIDGGKQKLSWNVNAYRLRIERGSYRMNGKNVNTS